jgi:hypothetical protein
LRKPLSIRLCFLRRRVDALVGILFEKALPARDCRLRVLYRFSLSTLNHQRSACFRVAGADPAFHAPAQGIMRKADLIAVEYIVHPRLIQA